LSSATIGQKPPVVAFADVIPRADPAVFDDLKIRATIVMKHFCVQLANPDNKLSSSSMSESIPVDDPGGSARSLPPKPRAAWLLQLFAAICLATSLVGLARLCTLVITDSSNVAMEVVLVSAVWRTLAVGVLFLAIVGTQRRKNYGRIFGLLLIAVVFGGLLYRQAVGSVEPSPWRLSYTNQQV
jgi:hypothetical protein